MKMSDDELHTAARKMEAHGGHFAAAIAEAYFRADSTNRQKLLNAFADLFSSYGPPEPAPVVVIEISGGNLTAVHSNVLGLKYQLFDWDNDEDGTMGEKLQQATDNMLTVDPQQTEGD